MEQVLIRCKDDEYMRRLVAAINKRAQGMFIALAVRSEEEYVNAMARPNVKLAFVQEGYERATDDEMNACIVLSETSDAKGTIYLYSKASEYIAFIRSELSIKAPGAEVEFKGSFGVITFAEINEACKYLDTRYGSYIMWNVSPYPVKGNEDKTVSPETVIYSIKMRDDSVSDKIREAVISDGNRLLLDAPVVYKDLRELDIDDIAYMLGNMGKLSAVTFAYVNVACLKDYECLNAFDKILVLDKNISGQMTDDIVTILKMNGISDEMIETVKCE